LQAQIVDCSTILPVNRLTNTKLSTVLPIAGSTWPAATRIKIIGTFTIDRSVTLSGVFFEMAPGATINIQGASTVVTASFTTFYGCIVMSNGIVVKNGASINFTSCTVKDAKTGITFNADANAVGSSLVSNTFANNRIGLFAFGLTAANPFRLAAFSGNNFTIWPNMLKLSNFATEPAVALRGIFLSNCIADISTPATVRNTVDQYRYGLYTLNSTVLVSNFTFDNAKEDITVQNDGTGLYADNTFLTVTGAGAANCVFTINSFAGIVSRNTRGLSVSGATFTGNLKYGIFSEKNNFFNPVISIMTNTFNMSAHNDVSAIRMERPASIMGGSEIIRGNTITENSSKQDMVLIDVTGLNTAEDFFLIDLNPISVSANALRAIHGIKISGKGSAYYVGPNNTLSYVGSSSPTSGAGKSFGIVATDLKDKISTISTNTITGNTASNNSFVKSGIELNNDLGNTFVCSNTPNNVKWGIHTSNSLPFTFLKSNTIGSAFVGLICDGSMPDQTRFNNLWTGTYGDKGAKHTGSPDFNIIYDGSTTPNNDGPPVVTVDPLEWFTNLSGPSNTFCGLQAQEKLGKQEKKIISGETPETISAPNWDDRRHLLYKLIRDQSIAIDVPDAATYLNNNLNSSAYKFAYAEHLYDQAFVGITASNASLTALTTTIWDKSTNFKTLAEQQNNAGGGNASITATQKATFDEWSTATQSLSTLQDQYRVNQKQDFINAANYLVNLPETEIYEYNLKTLLGIANRYAQGDSLVEPDYKILRNIAKQCTKYGGISVRTAPFWMQHEEAVTYVSDFELYDCKIEGREEKAVNNIFNAQGSVVPIPANNQITITTPKVSKGTWQIFNMQGRLMSNNVWSEPLSSFSLEVNNWNSGIYILVFRPEQGISSQIKFVISQ
jgi:Secretion system C-terminal sorting domain